MELLRKPEGAEGGGRKGREGEGKGRGGGGRKGEGEQFLPGVANFKVSSWGVLESGEFDTLHMLPHLRRLIIRAT